MPEVSDGINQLFSTGLTREAFIERYKELKEAKQLPEEAIFSKEISDTMLGAMYDTFHSTTSASVNNEAIIEDVSTENDIKILAGLDGDDTSISEEDLVQLYQQTLTKFENAQVSFDGIIDANSPSNLIYPSEMLDVLSFTKVIKIKTTNIEKAKIQSEIDDLIANSKGLNNELKTEYDTAKQNINTANALLLKKQQEYEIYKNKNIEVNNSIARKRGELDGIEDEDRKEDLTNEISDLSTSSQAYLSKSSSISSEISSIKATIQVANTRMNSITSKILSNDKQTAKKVQNKQNKIVQIERNLENELKEIDSRIEELNQQRQETLYKIGQENAQYMNNIPTQNNSMSFKDFEAKGIKYSNSKGQKLANDMIGHSVGFTHNCSKYVRQGLQRVGLYNGHTAHAYQMADVLAKNGNFQEINPNDVNLKQLPAGCILVYGKGAAGYSKESGHIEVTLGDGTACSDGRTRNLRSTNNMRIFVPVENA